MFARGCARRGNLLENGKTVNWSGYLEGGAKGAVVGAVAGLVGGGAGVLASRGITALLGQSLAGRAASALGGGFAGGLVGDQAAQGFAIGVSWQKPENYSVGRSLIVGGIGAALSAAGAGYKAWRQSGASANVPAMEAPVAEPPVPPAEQPIPAGESEAPLLESLAPGARTATAMASAAEATEGGAAPQVRRPTQLSPTQGGRYLPYDTRNYPVHPSSQRFSAGLPDGEYAYVLDRNNVLYVAPDAPHIHPQILGGGMSANGAGSLVVRNGQVVEISNFSGTFRPHADTIQTVREAIVEQGGTVSDQPRILTMNPEDY